MLQNRKFGAFSSSENPDELAGRVKAFILGAGTLIIWGAFVAFKITLTPADITQLATGISGVVAALWFVYSALKSLVIWAIGKWHTRTV